MYSNEIQALLDRNNHTISPEVYRDIVISSSQIDHVRYDPYQEFFQAWTDDGYSWEFRVVPAGQPSKGEK